MWENYRPGPDRGDESDRPDERSWPLLDPVAPVARPPRKPPLPRPPGGVAFAPAVLVVALGLGALVVGVTGSGTDSPSPTQQQRWDSCIAEYEGRESLLEPEDFCSIRYPGYLDENGTGP